MNSRKNLVKNDSGENPSRAQFLFFGVLFVATIFAFRLFVIQVVQHNKYEAQADAMQTKKQTIHAARGQIFARDSDGSMAPLVLNRTVYTLWADPSYMNQNEVAEFRETVQKIAGGEIIEGSLAKLDDKKLQYVTLAQKISYKQASEIKAKNFKGVGFSSDTERVYPEGNLAAQVLGFVNSDGEGQYGVEQFLNAKLAGQNGLLKSVTDARQIPLTIGAHDVSTPAKDGENVVLSIDRNIQYQAEKLLADGLKKAGAKSGSVVVMDPRNGRVRAMASAPSFDPAQYGKVTDAANFQAKVVTESVEPGSVFKSLTVGAAMDSGAIARNSQFYNPGCVQVDDAKICNVSRQVDGQMMDMTSLLGWSLNTGVVWVLQQMGDGRVINLRARKTLYDYFVNHFRLGEKTGVEISGESGSFISEPDMNAGPRVKYANMGFGQGLQVTLIQFIAAFSAAINGGKYYQPTIVLGTTEDGKKVRENSPKLIADNVLKPEISRNLKEMLYEARRDITNGKVLDKGYYVGGKSGTAQKIDPQTGKYLMNSIRGTYVGFGADKTKTPRYVIMVMVDEAGAGEIFTEMSNFMIQYEGISK